MQLTFDKIYSMCLADSPGQRQGRMSACDSASSDLHRGKQLLSRRGSSTPKSALWVGVQNEQTVHKLSLELMKHKF